LRTPSQILAHAGFRPQFAVKVMTLVSDQGALVVEERSLLF